MNNSFIVIFLALLIGCVIGYEFGKYTAAKRMRETFGKMCEDLAKDINAKTVQIKQQIIARKDPYNLQGFKTEYYKLRDNIDIPEGFNRKEEINEISNLILAMVGRGGTPEELSMAIKYSMVVLDTDKLKLDWKQARKEFCIDILESKYMQEELNNCD